MHPWEARLTTPPPSAERPLTDRASHPSADASHHSPPPAGRDALRVGLVGYGLGGSVFHAPLVAATPGLVLAAVVTRDPARRAQVAADHPGARCVDDARALWEDGDAVDVVVVASPNATHAPLALDALAAGRHVVVDKPFATTAAAGRRVADLARERGLLAIPFQNRRWDGDFLTVRRLVDDGSLGTVTRFESRFERWRATPRPRWTAADAREHAEGVVYDLGSHLVDQALVLFGPARSVYAELDRRHAGVATDDDAFIAITHASGVRSRLVMSIVAGQSGPRFAVYGSGGAYVKHGLDPQEDALKAGRRPGMDGWGEEPEARWGTAGIGDDARPVRTERGAYERFYEGVVRAVRDGAPPPVRAEESVAALAVIEAAYRASESGCAVAINEAGPA